VILTEPPAHLAQEEDPETRPSRLIALDPELSEADWVLTPTSLGLYLSGRL